MILQGPFISSIYLFQRLLFVLFDWSLAMASVPIREARCKQVTTSCKPLVTQGRMAQLKLLEGAHLACAHFKVLQ